jgi:head-tail adaptor
VAVTLYVQSAKSATGANVFADSLAGGGAGIDFGQVVNGQYAPIIDQPTNDGALVVFLNHDATIDPITNLKLYLGSYALTGAAYGGAASAAGDLADVFAEGQASDESAAAKNNSNGLAGGLWVDMQWDVSTTSQFDVSTRSANVKIFGNGGTQGIDAASAFTVSADAMLYSANDISEVDATTPVAGSIGKNNDTVLGDYAKLRFRIYLRTAFPDGGIFQAALVARYSFTA